MGKLDSSSKALSLETNELAWELKQDRPDICRIKWLVNDMGADVPAAVLEAHLEPSALYKNPQLRALKLYEHIKLKLYEHIK